MLLKKLLGAGGGTPFMVVTGVLASSGLVDSCVDGVYGEWPCKKYVFVRPVCLRFSLFGRDDVSVRVFEDVRVLCVVGTLNVFCECFVTCGVVVDHFVVLNDVYRVELDVS